MYVADEIRKTPIFLGRFTARGEGRPLALRVDADRRRVVIANRVGFRTFDFEGRMIDEAPFSEPPTTDEARAVAVSQDGSTLAFVGSDWSCVSLLWRGDPGGARRLDAVRGGMRFMRFADDADLVMAGSDGGTFCVWSGASGDVVRRTDVPGRVVVDAVSIGGGAFLICFGVGSRWFVEYVGADTEVIREWTDRPVSIARWDEHVAIVDDRWGLTMLDIADFAKPAFADPTRGVRWTSRRHEAQTIASRFFYGVGRVLVGPNSSWVLADRWEGEMRDVICAPTNPYRDELHLGWCEGPLETAAISRDGTILAASGCYGDVALFSVGAISAHIAPNGA